MPDLYRLGELPWCGEYKCFSPYVVQPLVGVGSTTHGGCPSQAEGWLTAFGGTEEALRRVVLGVPARGELSDAPLDRRTGLGRVHATRSPDYADALSKGYSVSLLVAETTGAVSPELDALLHRLARIAAAASTADHTQYGEAPSSPRDFYSHYLAAHAAAVCHADAVTILEQATTLSYFCCVA